MASDRFKRGAKRATFKQLAEVRPFVTAAPPPPQVAYIPAKLDVWGNDQYGDCVTAEEAFAKATYTPEIFIPADAVMQWAQAHGWLNGADLPSVMQAMQTDGFRSQDRVLNDGPFSAVDYTDEDALRAAIAHGPVKIAIDANALPGSAGSHNGWSAFGGRPGQHPNTDHCVAVCGYGPTEWLAKQVGASLPAGAPVAGYLLFTWGTIGVVDHAWLMSTCVEAYLRVPTTVGVPPLDPPTPPTPPVPPTPGPGPEPGPSPGPRTFTITIPPIVVSVSGGIGAAALPPWLLPILRALCSQAGKLPAPWSMLAGLICANLPPGILRE